MDKAAMLSAPGFKLDSAERPCEAADGNCSFLQAVNERITSNVPITCLDDENKKVFITGIFIVYNTEDDGTSL